MAGVAAHTPGMCMPVPVPYHPFQCMPLVPLPFNIITHVTERNPRNEPDVSSRTPHRCI